MINLGGKYSPYDSNYEYLSNACHLLPTAGLTDNVDGRFQTLQANSVIAAFFCAKEIFTNPLPPGSECCLVHTSWRGSGRSLKLFLSIAPVLNLVLHQFLLPSSECLHD